MRIIETCPKCGHDLINMIICTNPPIPRKSCPSCGWSWEGNTEKVIRVSFGGNDYKASPCETCSNNPKNGGSGICNCTLGLPEIRW